MSRTTHSEEDPYLVAEQAVDLMKQEYDSSLEVSKIEQRIGQYDVLGYELNFYCLDLTNTAMIFGTRSEEWSMLVHYQAEDQEFEQNRQVFLAITTSLLTD